MVSVAGSLFWVAVGGALGSCLRFLVMTWLGSVPAVRFPWGTLTVNVVGSFLIGLVVTWALSRAGGATELRLFLATGVLGGFTTFSAFSLDVLLLIERQDWVSALVYAITSVLLSVIAVAAGLALGRALWA